MLHRTVFLEMTSQNKKRNVRPTSHNPLQTDKRHKYCVIYLCKKNLAADLHNSYISFLIAKKDVYTLFLRVNSTILPFHRPDMLHFNLL